jgi:hypothetical protein
MAASLYWTVIVSVVGAVVLGGVGDLSLYLRFGYDGTITAWLRKNPVAFLLPVGLLLLFTVLLTIHLYICRFW